METQDLLILKLKKIVKERFSNQKTFCQSFGINESQFSQYLKGKNYIGIELLDKIAKHCNVDISYFFLEDDVEALNEDLFDEVFYCAYKFADENDIQISGSYFIGCYEIVKQSIIKNKVDVKTAFKDNEKIILRLVKKK